MKKIIFYFSTFILSIFNLESYSQNADLQIIHNAADPAATTVDIYVDGTLALNDFSFRSATPFLSLPSNVVINVGVAPSTSMSVMDTLVNFPITLAPGGRYVAIANGVLDPNSFSPNPDAVSTAFTLFIKDNIQSLSSNPANVDFIVVHGSTDAPTVDVLARGVASLVDDASYSDITNYISVPASDYILDVTPGGSNSTIVASFAADLSTLAGGTAVVVASGFLDSTVNQNGPAFGLWAYLSNGTAIQLPVVSLARLQVIHNAADPGASSVDVYLNGALLLDNFAFRTATPYIDAPAGVNLNIGIAPGNSTSVADTLVNFQATLDNGNSYVAIANGVLTPGSFQVNPDGVSTAFTLFIQDAMRETAALPGTVDLRVVHGATDAPTVDVIARGVGTIVDDAAYSAITPYLSVPAAAYTLDITPGNNNSVIVATFAADLSTLGGGAAVVLASGFLDPSMNQNGQTFGLIAVLPDGQVLLLSNVTGIEENAFGQFNMYPNPATDKLNIEFQDLQASQLSVSVTDLSGRIVKQAESTISQNKLTINTSGLTGGTYVIRVTDNQKVLVKKFSVH